jgi:hypothetical protein
VEPVVPPPTRAPPPAPAAAPTLPDRNGPFAGDPTGVASAITSHVGEIAACWGPWRAGHPDAPSQPLLNVVLRADGDRGVLGPVALASGDGGDFDGCVTRALSDTTFAPPAVGLLTLVVPVPIPPGE